MLVDPVAQDGNIRLVMKNWPIFDCGSLRTTRLTLRAAEMGEFADAHTALMATKAHLSADHVQDAMKDAVIDIDAATPAFGASSDKWRLSGTQHATG